MTQPRPRTGQTCRHYAAPPFPRDDATIDDVVESIDAHGVLGRCHRHAPAPARVRFADRPAEDMVERVATALLRVWNAENKLADVEAARGRVVADALMAGAAPPAEPEGVLNARLADMNAETEAAEAVRELPGYATHWPHVEERDWCGEWARARATP